MNLGQKIIRGTWQQKCFSAEKVVLTGSFVGGSFLILKTFLYYYLATVVLVRSLQTIIGQLHAHSKGYLQHLLHM